MIAGDSPVAMVLGFVFEPSKAASAFPFLLRNGGRAKKERKGQQDQKDLLGPATELQMLTGSSVSGMLGKVPG